MSKEYTKDQLLEAYKAGWNNALNGVGSLSTEAAFGEWLEGLRTKVEEPPRPDVRWEKDGRKKFICYVNGTLMGYLHSMYGRLHLLYDSCSVPYHWASPSFDQHFDDCREEAEYYFIRAYNICVKERTGDGC